MTVNDVVLEKTDIIKIKPLLIKGLKNKTDDLLQDLTELKEHFDLFNIIEDIYHFSDNLCFTSKHFEFEQINQISQLLKKIYKPLINREIRINKEIIDMTETLLVCLNEWEEFKYSKTEFEKFYSKTLNNINEIIEFAFKCVEKNKNKEIKTKKIMVSSEELFNLKNCMDDIYSNYSFLMDELETNIPERYLNKRWYNKIKNIEKSFLYNLTEIQKEYFNFRKVNLYDMLDELEFKIRNYAMKLNKTVKFNFINDDILVDVFYIGNISKIIYELVKNCVEHSFKNKSGNEITIKFDSYENNMQISIIDNGKGFDVDEIIKNSKNKNIIDDKELDNIDNIFFNLVLYGLKNKNKGLYKIKNYVQQLKGKIKFDIKNKKGTKVYIIFPIFKKIV